MKATGIVRRIDELGRVVIPKEIRRTLKIREGSPLEIFTNTDGSVVFKKYSQLGEMENYTDAFAKSIFTSFGAWCVITDLDKIISAAGSKMKELVGKNISEEVKDVMEKRSEREIEVPLYENSDKFTSYIFPIVHGGDVCGAIATGKPSEAEGFLLCMKTFSEILSSMQE